jgi:hypothetical protein
MVHRGRIASKSPSTADCQSVSRRTGYRQKGWRVAARGCFNIGMQSPTKQFIAGIVTTLICIAALTEVPGQVGAVYTAAEAAKHIGENATINDISRSQSTMPGWRNWQTRQT